jgi:hypothetical protein
MEITIQELQKALERTKNLKNRIWIISREARSVIQKITTSPDRYGNYQYVWKPVPTTPITFAIFGIPYIVYDDAAGDNGFRLVGEPIEPDEGVGA